MLSKSDKEAPINTAAQPRALEDLENRLLFAGVPVSPSNLLASSLSSNQIDLTWTDRSDNETGFVIQRAMAEDLAAGKGESAWGTIGSAGVNVQVYHDSSGLSSGAKYAYRVLAVNEQGSSPASTPTIGNALELFEVGPGHTEAQRVGGWQWGLPGNRVDLLTDVRNNVFYAGQPVLFTQQWNTGNASRYEVRDYWGNMVDSGPAAPVGQQLQVNVTNPGWYKIYLYANTVADGRFGDVIGGTTFSIFRNDPNFPALPSKNVVTTNPGSDEVMRGVTGMGPQRHNVTDATNPAGMIAGLAPEIEFDKQYYLPYDQVRKRDLLIAFSNGTRDWSNRGRDQVYLDGVRQIVQRFHNDVKFYEGRNEPNFFVSPAQYVDELRDLYNVVKSVDPTCKIIGPGCVDLLSGYGLAWLDQFLAAGGDKYVDGVSFHAYNNINGDLSLARDSLEGLNRVLAKYGLQNIDKWQTEQGAFAALYGSFQPRLQGRWDMLQMLVQEQYGITKEHNHLWYDRSGFWDVPAFWEVADDNSLTPAATLMRVYSEEVYGTNFNRAFDFGANGNALYLGNLYTGPSGKAVAAFMSAGSTDGKITLNVSGGSTLKVTDAMGNSTLLPVVNGQVSLDVPETPVYVDLASGQSIDVVKQDFGQNLARQSGVTLKTSGDGQNPLGGGWLNSIGKVTNGVLDSWYNNQSADGDVWYDHTPAGQPAWFEIDLPSVQTVGRVDIFSGVPWSLRGSLLDYELQADQNGSWVTLEHVQENPKTIGVYSPWLRTTVDSYYSDRWIFQHELAAPVTTSKLRILVHEETYGGGATQKVVEAGGQTGFHQFNLREIEIYGPSSQSGVNPLSQASLFNSGPIPQGGSATVTFVTPPAVAGPTYSYDFDNDGVFEITGSGQSTVTVPTQYLPTTGSKTVRGRITDSSGGFMDYTTVLSRVPTTPTDTQRPVATLLTALRVRSAGGTFYKFTVRYTDETAIDLAQLDSSDVIVTGPGGFSSAVRLLSKTRINAKTVDGFYRLAAKGGTWDRGDNGLYTVEQVTGEVMDQSSNPAVAGDIGAFTVRIAKAVPAAVAAQAVTGAASGFSTMRVGKGKDEEVWG